WRPAAAMRLPDSLSHATDTLASERAGHLLRASALLAELSRQGHEVLRIEAAGTQGSAAAVGAYRGVVRRLLPRGAALKLRDAGRVVMARRSGRRLIAAARAFRPDVIFETHTSFGLAGQLAAAATGAPRSASAAATSQSSMSDRSSPSTACRCCSRASRVSATNGFS